MADFLARLKPKKSSVSGETPSAGDLEVAEIAVNTADGKLFVKHTDNTIKEISGSGGGGGGAVDSVNGETGAVSLGIQDMDDFELNTINIATFGRWIQSSSNSSTPGEFFPRNVSGQDYIRISKTDADGVDFTSYFADKIANSPADGVWVSTDGTNWTSVAGSYEVSDMGDGSIRVNINVHSNASVGTGNEQYIALADPLSASNLQDVPLAEGDILQWDNGDQKFKPTQNKERIQDMDDFELNPSASVVQGIKFDRSNDSGVNGDKFHWNEQSSAGFIEISGQRWFVYSEGGGDDGSVPDFVVGTDYTFYHQGASATYTCNAGQALYANATAPETTNRSFYVTMSAGVWPAGWNTNGDVDNGPIYVDYDSLDPKPHSGAFDPLANGDILQWVDADQKFKPAQLPIDSVNGETGVVSLGIQDMDDFSLATPTIANTVILNNKLSSGTCSADGDFSSINNDNGNIGDYFLFYNDGDDAVEFNKLTGGDPLVFTFDDDSTHVTTFVAKGINTGVEGYMTIADNWPAAAFSTNSLKVYNTQFSDGAPAGSVPTPLADGDILRWDATDSKFKPEALSGGGGGAVDSVNGETGTVSLGIQDMNDFGLQEQPGGGYPFTWDSTPGTPGTGEAVVSNAGWDIHFSTTTNTGTDISAELNILNNNSITEIILYANGGGGTFGVTQIGNSGETVSLDADGEAFLATLSAGDELLLDHPTLLPDAPAGAQVPLLEDQVLAWDTVESKFRPETLDLDYLSDVEIEQPPSDIGTYDTRVYSSNGGSNLETGEFFQIGSNPYRLEVARVNKAGEDTSAFFDALGTGAGSIWITQGGVVKEITYTSKGSYGAPGGSGTAGYAFYDTTVDIGTTEFTVLPGDPSVAAGVQDKDVLSYDSGQQKFVNRVQSPRFSETHTSSSLLGGASDNLSFTTAGSGGMFRQVTTDQAAYVTFYTSSAARSADAGRNPATTPPTASDGVLLEVLTAASTPLAITPAIPFFVTAGDGTLLARVINNSGSETTVEVTLDGLTLEY